MSEMIERVARALYADQTAPMAQDWEQESHKVLAQWRGAAHAAIKAMREPSEGMLDRADHYTDLMPDTKAEFATLYRHMIDAALSQSGEGASLLPRDAV